MSELVHLAGRIAAKEAAVSPTVRPGCEARIVWDGAPATQTDIALVYVHGFSASPEELRPVPDMLAKALGANIYFARLSGHGQGGAAMATATYDAWRKDVDHALEVGRALGRRTLLMGCSTGCTLNTLAAASGAELAGVIHMSPNYAMASKVVQWILDAPGAMTWAPWIMGKERVFEPLNDAHEAYWTTRYPSRSVKPMADAIRAVRASKLGTITAPAMFAYAEEDQIVSPAEIRRVMSRWGGPVKSHVVELNEGDDENAHVIAGDVFSPSQTAGVAQVLIDWANEAL